MVPTQAELETRVAEYRGATFADSTKRSYSTFIKSYLQFCALYNVLPVPASSQTVSLYIAYIADRLCANSVGKYLTAVRLLHLEAGLPNPVKDNWYIDSVLRGVRKKKGVTVTKKLPITPHILLQIKSRLDLSVHQNILFWGACLLGFFGMLRRSNFLPASAAAFDPKKHLRRTDIQVMPWGLAVTIRWSKTIQVRERVVIIPLPVLKAHPLCPASALTNVFRVTSGAPPLGPVFVSTEAGSWVPLTAQAFVRRLKDQLQALGLPASQYAGHSLRRGGATWALHAGLPRDIIRLMGDWRSDACFEYFEMPVAAKVKYYHLFSQTLPSSAPPGSPSA